VHLAKKLARFLFSFYELRSRSSHGRHGVHADLSILFISYLPHPPQPSAPSRSSFLFSLWVTRPCLHYQTAGRASLSILFMSYQARFHFQFSRVAIEALKALNFLSILFLRFWQ